MEVHVRLQKTVSGVRVTGMIEHEKLGYASIATAVAVLVAMWICKDIIMAALSAPSRTKAWTRQRWLALRGMQEYVGRHRVAT